MEIEIAIEIVIEIEIGIEINIEIRTHSHLFVWAQAKALVELFLAAVEIQGSSITAVAEWRSRGAPQFGTMADSKEISTSLMTAAMA